MCGWKDTLSKFAPAIHGLTGTVKGFDEAGFGNPVIGREYEILHLIKAMDINSWPFLLVERISLT